MKRCVRMACIADRPKGDARSGDQFGSRRLWFVYGYLTASRAFVAQQVVLTVEGAVDKRAALRVIVFAGLAGNARTVVGCPVMSCATAMKPLRPATLARVKQLASDQVWLAVLKGRPAMARPGKSVVGGYVALADARPLTTGRREAVILSDGILAAAAAGRARHASCFARR
jgi:hypothetical protein